MVKHSNRITPKSLKRDELLVVEKHDRKLLS